MKTTFTLMFLAVFALGVNAQLQLPADFETAMEDTVWNQFANAGDAPENMGQVENPAKDGINTSDSCLLITVLDNADPWVGAWSEAYGPLEFTTENHMMEMMVHKTVTSNCGIKLESGDGDNVEVLVPNTKVGEWELLTFDMTAAIGHTYNRLVIFPDFPDPRTAGSTCYIDNIGWVGSSVSVKELKPSKMSIFPNPAAEWITLQYPGINSVILANIVGQTVKSLEFQGTNQEIIDVSDLEEGVYLIILDTADGTISSRFVKE